MTQFVILEPHNPVVNPITARPVTTTPPTSTITIKHWALFATFQIFTLCMLGIVLSMKGSYEIGQLKVHMAHPLQVGPISSVKPNTDGRPRLIMAVDINYPPYAYTRTPPYPDEFNGTRANYPLDEVVGVGVDMIKALGKHCGFDVTITQAKWSECWDTFHIGEGLREGWYHGCMTFTHAAGERNRFLDFSQAWAEKNKPAGLITRLDANGVPHIHGTNTLENLTIVDVTGWAPTADTLNFVSNQCTGMPHHSCTHDGT